MSRTQRLKKRFADEVVENFINPLLEGQRGLFEAIQIINKAHLIMLVEEKIIPEEDGKQIHNALIEVDHVGRTMHLDPYLHEIYNNIEHHVINAVGADTGGRMMTGRSRNDLYACAFRIVARDKILTVMTELSDVIGTLLRQSEKHHDTIMPGFTHAQPAQPTTLGHYLLSLADSLEEDILRLKDAYGRTNLNPLGAAAFAGTGFPINRARTTELMSFAGLVENSLKAVSDYNFLLETVSGLAIMMNNVSRFMADLVPWTSAIYGMFEIDDAFACTSSIMPQKKNPFTAETMRSIAGVLAGGLAQGLSITKGIPMGFNFDLLCFGGWGLEYIEQARKALRVLNGLLGSMIVHREAMARRAGEGFSTATEVADQLVRCRGMSFRTAHGIVAVAVRMAIEDGQTDLSADVVNRAAQQVLNQDLNLTGQDLGGDVFEIVAGRQSLGGASFSEVKRMLHARRDRLSETSNWIAEEVERIGQCGNTLDRLMADRFGNPASKRKA